MCVLIVFIYLQVVSRSSYDAFLPYLVDRNAGRRIDWGAAVMENYVRVENSCNQEEGLDFQLEKNRKNFIRKASR